MFRKVIFIILFSLMLTLAGCDSDNNRPATPVPSETPAPTGVIVVGKLGDDPTEEIEEHQSLVDYLAANLGEFGIGEGSVKVTLEFETMADLMNGGEVDFFIDSPWSALSLADQTGGQILARRIKAGEEEKHAIIFALADRGLATLEDLPGNVIAFEEPDSTSGYMLPLGLLLESGLTVNEAATSETTASADEVLYIFSGDDDNTLEWVLAGRVAVGAVDNDAYIEFTDENSDVFVILAETQPISRDQYLIARGDMDEELFATLTTLLLGIDELNAAENILPPETVRFDNFSGAAQIELETMQALYATITGD